jgi:hypothetical protein
VGLPHAGVKVKGGRPTRPTDEAAEIERAAAKLEGEKIGRMVIETRPTILKALRLAAARKGVTNKAFVLEVLRAAGVEGITDADLGK